MGEVLEHRTKCLAVYNPCLCVLSSWVVDLTKLIGSRRIRTTAYHPQSNGLVERFHRQLKSSLRAHLNPNHWCDLLPITLLGIRSALKVDIGCSTAQLIYGTALRLPGEIIAPISTSSFVEPNVFVSRLRKHMADISPVGSRVQNSAAFVPTMLLKCSHVFVRDDSIKHLLIEFLTYILIGI